MSDWAQTLQLCFPYTVEKVCKVWQPNSTSTWRYESAKLAFAQLVRFFFWCFFFFFLKANSSWTKQSWEESARDNFVELIQGFQNHIWFMGIRVEVEVESWSWSWNWRLDPRGGSSRLQLQFWASTSTPIINMVRHDFIDLNELYKNGSGCFLRILHRSGDMNF
jgi:hypothetical protein